MIATTEKATYYFENDDDDDDDVNEQRQQHRSGRGWSQVTNNEHQFKSNYHLHPWCIWHSWNFMQRWGNGISVQNARSTQPQPKRRRRWRPSRVGDLLSDTLSIFYLLSSIWLARQRQRTMSWHLAKEQFHACQQIYSVAVHSLWILSSILSCSIVNSVSLGLEMTGTWVSVASVLAQNDNVWNIFEKSMAATILKSHGHDLTGIGQLLKTLISS